MNFIYHVFLIWVCLLLYTVKYVCANVVYVMYIGMYLTDLTFLDLRHKKNDTLSTPITPVSRFADNSRHTPPISNIQAQVKLCVLVYVLALKMVFSD